MDMRIVLTDQVNDEKECSFELFTHEENVKSIQLELYLERDLEFAISFDLEELEKAIKILKVKK